MADLKAYETQQFKDVAKSIIQQREKRSERASRGFNKTGSAEYKQAVSQLRSRPKYTPTAPATTQFSESDSPTVWDQSSLSFGGRMFYDSSTNSITGVETATPLYFTDDGVLTYEETQNPATYTRAMESNVTGELPESGYPSIDTNIKAGEALFFDPTSNLITNDSNERNMPLFWQDGTGDGSSYDKKLLTIEDTGNPAHADTEVIKNLMDYSLFSEDEEAESYNLTGEDLLRMQYERDRTANSVFNWIWFNNKEINPSRFTGYAAVPGEEEPQPVSLARKSSSNLLHRIFVDMSNTVKGWFGAGIQSKDRLKGATLVAVNPLLEAAVTSLGYLANFNPGSTLTRLRHGGNLLNTTPGEAKFLGIDWWTDYQDVKRAWQDVGRALNTTMTGESAIDKYGIQSEYDAKLIYSDAATIHMDAHRQAQEASVAVQSGKIAPENAQAVLAKSVDDLVEAYKMEKAAGAYLNDVDPMFAYTFLTMPEREEQFLNAMAQIELQQGEPLNVQQMEDLKDYFVSLPEEMLGEVILDPLNVLDLIGGGLIVKAGAGVISKSDNLVKALSRAVSRMASGQMDELARLLSRAGIDGVTEISRITDISRKVEVITQGLQEFKASGIAMREKPFYNRALKIADNINSTLRLSEDVANGIDNSTFDALTHILEQSRIYTRPLDKDGNLDIEAAKKLFSGQAPVIGIGGRTSISDMLFSIPIQAIGKLGGGIRNIPGLDAVLKTVGSIPPFNVINWMSQLSARSVARKVGFESDALIRALAKDSSGISGEGKTIRTSLDELGGFVRRIVENKEPYSDVAAEAQKIGITDRMLSSGIMMADLTEVGEKGRNYAEWGSVLMNAHRQLQEEARLQLAIDALGLRGRFVDQTAEELLSDLSPRAVAEIEKKARGIAENNLNLAEAFSRHFQSKYIETRRVPHTSLMDDTVIGWLASNFQHDKKILDALDGMGKFVDLITGKWARAVLGRRPGWLVYNSIESGFRFLFHDGNPLNNFGYLAPSVADIVKENFHLSTTSSIFGNLSQGVESIFDIKSADMGAFSFARNYASAWNRNLQKLGERNQFVSQMLGRMKMPFSSFVDAIRDTNNAMESGLRIRKLNQLIAENYNKVNERFVQSNLKEFDRVFRELDIQSSISDVDVDARRSQLRTVYENILRLGGKDPEKVRAMADLSFEGSNLVNNVVLIDAAFDDTLIGMTYEDKQQFLEPVLHQVMEVFQDIMKTGREVTDQDVSVVFSQLKDFVRRQNNALSNVAGWTEVSRVISENARTDLLYQDKNIADFMRKIDDGEIKANTFGDLDEATQKMIAKYLESSPTPETPFDDIRKGIQNRQPGYRPSGRPPGDVRLDDATLKKVTDETGSVDSARNEINKAVVFEEPKTRRELGETLSKLQENGKISEMEWLTLDKALIALDDAFNNIAYMLRERMPDSPIVNGVKRTGKANSAAWEMYFSSTRGAYDLKAGFNRRAMELLEKGEIPVMPMYYKDALSYFSGAALRFNEDGSIHSILIPARTYGRNKYFAHSIESPYLRDHALRGMGVSPTITRDQWETMLLPKLDKRTAARLEEMNLTKGTVQFDARGMKSLTWDDFTKSSQWDAVANGDSDIRKIQAIMGHFNCYEDKLKNSQSTYAIARRIMLKHSPDSKYRAMTKPSEIKFTNEIWPDVYDAVQRWWRNTKHFDITEVTETFKDDLIEVIASQYKKGTKGHEEAIAQAMNVYHVYDSIANSLGDLPGGGGREGIWKNITGFYKGDELTKAQLRDKRAMTTVTATGKAIITSLNNPNPIDAMHEFFHAVEQFIPERSHNVLLEWAESEIKAGNITKDLQHIKNQDELVREVIVKGFELRLSEIPSQSSWYKRLGKKVKQVFDAIADLFTSIYKRNYKDYYGDLSLSNEARKEYDRILGNQTWLKGDEITSQRLRTVSLSKQYEMKMEKAELYLANIIKDQGAFEFWSSRIQRGLSLKQINKELDKLGETQPFWKTAQRLTKDEYDNVLSLVPARNAYASNVTTDTRWYRTRLESVFGDIPERFLDKNNEIKVSQLKKLLPGLELTTDELYWSGLAETIELWLAGDPEMKVPVEYLQDWARRNKIEVNEIVLRGEDTEYSQWTLVGRVNEKNEYIPHPNYYELLVTSPYTLMTDPIHFTDTVTLGELQKVIGHTRMVKEELPNGKNLLFVEEVQSDWAQGGRKRGFTDEFVGQRDLEGDVLYTGPFQDSYNELMLKRILTWAVDNDVDYLAWTTGVEQWQRYGSEKIAWKQLSADNPVDVLYDWASRHIDLSDYRDQDVADAYEVLQKYAERRQNGNSSHEILLDVVHHPGMRLIEEILDAVKDKELRDIAFRATSLEQLMEHLIYDVRAPIVMAQRNSSPLYKVTVNMDGMSLTKLIYDKKDLPRQLKLLQIDEEQASKMWAMMQNNPEVTMDDPYTVRLRGMTQVYDKNLINGMNKILKRIDGSKMEIVGTEFGNRPVLEITDAVKDSISGNRLRLFQSTPPKDPGVEAFNAYIDSRIIGGKYSIRDLLLYLVPTDEVGEEIFDDPQVVLTMLQAVIQRMGTEIIDDTGRKAMQSMYDELSYFYRYITKADDDIMLPPIQMWTTPTPFLYWFEQNQILASRGNAVNKGLDLLENKFKKALSSPLMQSFTDTEKKFIKELGETAYQDKLDLMDKVQYGGTYRNANLTDAVGEMNRIMLDYGTRTNFDEMMKTFVPFWMFPSRSLPFWMDTIGRHPEMGSFYFKYLAHSRRSALQAGATNTKGESLPSLSGYMPIPGTSIWINPTAPLIFRYIFPNAGYVPETETSKDQSIVSSLLGALLEESQLRGFGLSPLFYALLSQHSMNAYPRSGLMTEAIKIFVPLELIPPNLERWIMHKMRVYAQPDLPETWNPQVEWKDYLVEREMLKEGLQMVQAAEGDRTKQLQIVQRITAALSNPDRESNEYWLATRDKMERQDYYRKMASYFTGFYPKSFDPAYAELMGVRDEINVLKKSINDELFAQLFEIQGTPEDRYENYTQYMYSDEDAEGWLYNDYQKIRWVEDNEGNQLFGQERRDAMAQMYADDEATSAYYDAIAVIADERERELAALPLGAPSEMSHEIWERYFASRMEIESNRYYDVARRPWWAGLKPQSAVEDYYRQMWWRMIEETRPRWNVEDGESYTNYKVKMDLWKAQMPQMAESMMPIFAANLGIEQATITEASEAASRTGQDLTKIPDWLMKETTSEGYEQYRLERDSVYDAVESAYDALVLDDWYELFDLSGSERELAEREYWRTHAELPSTEDVYEAVQAKYPGKFTLDEVRVAYEGRPAMDALDIANYGDSEFELQSNEIWDALGWAGPGVALSELRDALVSVGGDSSDLDVWYTVGGDPNAWSDPTEFQEFHDHIIEAVDIMNLQPPTDAELLERMTAEAINEEFKQTKLDVWGGALTRVQGNYFNMNSTERRKWRKQNPDDYQFYITDYYNYRDSFSRTYPAWAKYYNPYPSD